eukprot:6959702-Prymnesium_polylepis.2
MPEAPQGARSDPIPPLATTLAIGHPNPGHNPNPNLNPHQLAVLSGEVGLLSLSPNKPQTLTHPQAKPSP